MPHPCPHDHLALLVTKEGLLIRPHIPGQPSVPKDTTPYVRVSWGKNVKVEEITPKEDDAEIEWGDGTIVYGILGVLDLFSGESLRTHELEPN